MEEPRRVTLLLDLIVSSQQPISGTARLRAGRPHAFSGWSELFAVLQSLTADPGGQEREART